MEASIGDGVGGGDGVKADRGVVLGGVRFEKFGG